MEWLKIQTSTELVRIRTDEIVAVVAEGNYSNIRLYDKRELKLTLKIHSLDETFEKLATNPFVRISRSLIINVNYIFKISLMERVVILAGQPLIGAYRFEAPRQSLDALKKFVENGHKNDKPTWQTTEGGNDEQR